MRASAAELLSTATVREHLVRRGLVATDVPVEASELGGGVSNVVLAVRAGERELVVKQALPRLRVAEEWLANQQRAVAEARALELAGRLMPGWVPHVLDLDEASCTFAIERAPATWHPWKEALLGGMVEPAIGASLGTFLSTWHGASELPEAAAFEDIQAFVELRVDPYHRTAAARNPGLAEAIGACADELLAVRTSLVHGDFSPKNVLVGGNVPWVIDFEVTHVGNPVFDLAFLVNHLLLKAIHTEARDRLAATAAAFLDAYATDRPPPPVPELLRHTGCLTVARVDGKSPVEYLTDAGKATARGLGQRLVLDPPATLAAAFGAIP